MDRSKKRASAGAGGISAGIKRPRINPNVIGNKLKRAEVFAAWSMAKKKDRKARQNARKLEREQLGDAAPPKLQPHTLENTREADDTVVYPDDAEVLGDEADDEFALFYRSEKPTKIMITTGCHPSGKIYRMVAEFMAILPNCVFYKRRNFPLRSICDWATKQEFTHLIVLSEKAKKPNGLLVCALPFGPTAAFRLSSSMLSCDVKGHGNATAHVPELILNNFVTRLGRRIGRFVGSLFPPKAEFEGRRVCTFHNQRDFIFFRQHRYIFNDDGTGVRLQELGPRFTLKLKYILAGACNMRMGEYEWFHKRHQLETSKRKFEL